MPLIWDDSKWMCVNDEEPYDKSQFVVVRKLHIKPSYRNRDNQEFSIDRIRRQLRKFGEIESIELLPYNEPKAHVTFVNSRVAYTVQMQHQCNQMICIDRPYEIEPADTWEQPPEIISQQPDHDIEVDEQTSEIFMLNEKCLLYLFQFLDLDSLIIMADVCKMFNQLLHQHCFPHIQKHEVTNGPEFVLRKVRRTLLCIGQHITDLSFRAHYNYVMEEGVWSHYVDHRSSKFLRVLAQNVGQNVRRAYFEFGFNSHGRIMKIAPILRNLESLEIADRSYGSVNDIDFPVLCPNLIELKINVKMSMFVCCKPWLSLQILSVLFNAELKATTLISIIEQNSQLTCLKFSMRRGRIFSTDPPYGVLFTAITKHLSRLEKLTILIDIGNFPGYFHSLGELPILSELNLVGLKDNGLNNVIDHLLTFTNLRKTGLYGCCIRDSEIGSYAESLVNLARKLLLLEELELEYIPMKEETLVDIVRFGRQLKVLHVDSCKLNFSDELILKLVDSLKCYRQESDEALQLFLPREDLHKLDSDKNKEIERYLQLHLNERNALDGFFLSTLRFLDRKIFIHDLIVRKVIQFIHNL